MRAFFLNVFANFRNPINSNKGKTNHDSINDKLKFNKIDTLQNTLKNNLLKLDSKLAGLNSENHENNKTEFAIEIISNTQYELK